ncbi:CHAT domain-containing protein [Bradyrhizobium sp. CB1717]|uniref:DUF7379 domain-containing protein n=1 Tax=Bradyrhizobium sp. CB1717 TaxID=3039154 RepID=UPI0024B08B88|nr:CHAT domain-containing protein [Bradyrhizobium sp. CB1717]WFU22067.1 CHAT domain-containing protein [Bradyrhizobium sp. CB1717]
MAELEVANGIVVRGPDDVEIRIVQDGPVRRGFRRGTASQIDGANQLKGALSASDFTIAAEVEMVPTRPGTRALRRDASTPTQIEVEVGPSERALVLIEGAGGVYAWTYPQAAGQPSRQRGGGQVLVFPLTATTRGSARGVAPASGKRGPVLDWVSDKLIDPVRAYVLKFAARTAIDVATDYIEGDREEGIVVMAGLDPAAWTPARSARPRLPQDRPLKILLMVHGTFSSTASGFAQLAGSDSGKTFLSKASAHYDAVLGFDHKTLTVTPRENAAALVAALQALGIPKNSSIDAVIHSRGGLVYRVAENLLADERPDIRLGKAIFVGCTNAGTHLAEPENWAAMIDLYTNGIMAGVRAVSFLAGGAALSPVVSQGIKTVGRFVQAFSEVAIDEGRVPGLAAMRPTSDLVRELNGAAGPLDRLAAYHAITSNFVAQIAPDKGVTKEFAEFIADRVTNRLFQLDNDLVVDTASMTSFGTRGPRLAKDATFAFGDTDDVFHTTYFATDVVPSKLSEWLGLGAARPESVPAQIDLQQPPPRRSRRGVASIVESPLESSSAAREWESPGSGSMPDTLTLRRTRSRSAPSARPAEAREAPAAGDTPPPASTSPGSRTAACYFAAEIESHPPPKKPVPLFVTVSRQKIEAAESPASAALNAPVNVDTARAIVVEVIARKNCRVIGEASAEIDLPQGQRAESLRFVVEGTAEGAADILVEARQGPRILASFALAPVFVDADSKTLRKSQAGLAMAAHPDEPAVLRIYEIMESGKVTLRFDLACVDPNIAVSESRTLPGGFSRDVYVAEIFKGIESAWLATNRLYDQFLSRLQANGIVMANELLPDRVREALWTHRDAIRAIQVISEEPFIPWELLYINDRKSGPDGKGFLAEWGLVRWLHSTPWPGPQLAMRNDRVNCVIPAYVDPGLRLEGADAERQMLAKLFGSPREVTAESIAVTGFLQKDAKDCDVLHFACHGEAAQRAVMTADLLMTGAKVDGNFAQDSLSADQVKAYARFAESGPNPMVFINACQTGRAGRGIGGGVAGFVDAFLRPYSERGAGALVGALWSVDDKLAYSFAEAFYRSLKGGDTLVDAVRAAREAAKNRKELTWLAYSVYGNPFARVPDAS